MMRIAELTKVIKGFTIMLVLLIHSIAVAAIKTFQQFRKISIVVAESNNTEFLYEIIIKILMMKVIKILLKTIFVTMDKLL